MTDVRDPEELLPEREQLRYIAQQAADARLNVELETEGMTLNMGPQHPATHGTLRIVAKLDGEQVVAAEPVAGYMHRGYEKLSEVRTYPQVTTLVNRIDWVGSFANEVPFILAAEQLMGIEAPPRELRKPRFRIEVGQSVPLEPLRLVVARRELLQQQLIAARVRLPGDVLRRIPGKGGTQSREVRVAAVRWAAKSAARSLRRRAGCSSPPTTARWNCASWRTSRRRRR